MMTLTVKILTAIPSQEEANFAEFLRGLDSFKPESRDEWRQMFLTLEAFEAQGLVEIERGSDDKIETLQLTELGAERAREALHINQAKEQLK